MVTSYGRELDVQDTKDKTFDAEVARAYQTMSALMNYIRTVKDFGRCEGKAKGGNQYGIPYVSDCVRSQFEGPCTSSANPIPCGDNTCKPTFVNCLQALLTTEASKHTTRAELASPGDGSLMWELGEKEKLAQL